MTSRIRFLWLAAFTLLIVSAAQAQTVIDFEDGTDGATVTSPAPQLVFTPTNGSDWVYGDWRATITGGEPKYNGPYPDGAFWSEGNFFANMGPARDTGKITLDFGGNDSTFSVGYSSAGPIMLEAYDLSANMIASDSGDENLNTGQLGFLSVQGTIAWVVIGFLGNHWIIDHIALDEIVPCLSDEECDDNVYCNGPETCISGVCSPGIPVSCDDGLYCNGAEQCDEGSQSCVGGSPPNCPDDGVFCNGPEICSDSEGKCIHAGNPCQSDELCKEYNAANDIIARCVAPALETPPPCWPEGAITGGCCGC